jgi:hypothetical protein
MIIFSYERIFIGWVEAAKHILIVGDGTHKQGWMQKMYLSLRLGDCGLHMSSCLFGFLTWSCMKRVLAQTLQFNLACPAFFAFSINSVMEIQVPPGASLTKEQRTEMAKGFEFLGLMAEGGRARKRKGLPLVVPKVEVPKLLRGCGRAPTAADLKELMTKVPNEGLSVKKCEKHLVILVILVVL